MADLRTLLHESAPAPRRPLDMQDVRRRAQRPATRRALAWLGGLAVALGLGVPVGGAILAPAHRGEEVGVGGSAPTTTSVTVATASVDGDRPPTTSLPFGLTGRRPDGPPRDTDRVSASDLGRDDDPPPQAPTAKDEAPVPEVASSEKFHATEGYPLASACTVDNAGLGPRGQRTCRFTATTRGGAEMRSDGVANAAGNGADGQVTITRDGHRMTTTVQYNSARAGDLAVFGCGGLIEPGDLVEVVLTNGAGSPDGSTTTLGAGEGWHCWE